MIRRQSNNQWNSGIAAHPFPKNSECKNPLEKFPLRYFGIKTTYSSLIIFQRDKLSTRTIAHLCWCNWRTFWRKNAVRISPRGLVLARQCPGSPGTWNPEETGLLGLPMSWSHTLSSGYGPSHYHLFPGLKKQLKGCHFSSDANVVAAAETWLDGQPSEFFLNGLHKLE